MSVILFEDGLVPQLSPVTIGRPAFHISCGGYRLLDLATRLGQGVDYVVRRHLRDILRADHAAFPWTPVRPGGATLLVNARMVPSITVAGRLRALLETGQPQPGRAPATTWRPRCCPMAPWPRPPLRAG